MASIVNKNFGTNYTGKKFKSYYANHHLNSGLTGCFEKGHKPFNKGRKQKDYMSAESIEKTVATRFTKGTIPPNKRSVGDERITKDGYIEIKVAEPNKWELKHRYIWEQKNPKIKKGECIRFLDGNKQNCAIENLRLVPRDVNCELTTRPIVDSDIPEIVEVAITTTMLNCEMRKRRAK